jgi:hypothetical protein
MSKYNWQKSSYSGDSSNCLNITAHNGTIKLRESDNPDVIITTTPEKLRALILGIKASQYDHLTEG